MEIAEQTFTLAMLPQPLIKNVEESLVVNEFWIVSLSQTLECRQDVSLRIASQMFIRPQVVEPTEKRIPITGTADIDIEFYIGNGAKA